VKKQADLKKRLEELRDEPPGPVELRLVLDPELHEALKALASQKRMSLERYLERVMRNHVRDAAGEGGR
jgi:predicted HicB family RNase H-like nuclease